MARVGLHCKPAVLCAHIVHQCRHLQFLSKLATFVLVFLELAVLHFFLLQLPVLAGSVTRCRIPPIQLPLLVTVGREANVK